MKKVVKKWGWLLVALAMLIVTASCQSGANQTGTNGSGEGTKGTAEQKELILATTTSPQDTGLLDELIPVFETRTGYKVKTVAVGSGQALAMGEKGEADVLLTHAPEDEEKLEQQGDVLNRRRVMYNDFIVVGPSTDPAEIKGKGAKEAFVQMAKAKVPFISRGDDSGTHKKELSLWKQAGVAPLGQDWYIETGQGMGETLRIAAERQGYVLTDRGTYLVMKGLLKGMDILSEGDEGLLNIYHVMQVNPEKSELINHKAAETFVAFMVSDEGQELIGQFGVEEHGQPLFIPFAEKDPQSNR